MNGKKYHDIDTLLGESSDGVGQQGEAVQSKPRARRPSPSIGIATARVKKPTRAIDAVKEKAQKDIAEVEAKFDLKTKALQKELEEAWNAAGSSAAPMVSTMPVTKQKVKFKLMKLDPSLIDVSSENERIQGLLDEISLQDILPSIRKHGQQKPGTVRPKKDGRFELIEGSRRKAAVSIADQLYLAWVGDIPDADVRELSVIENKHKDVSPYEKAMAYRKQIDNGEYENWTQLGAAKGISSSHISRYRACAELEEKYVRILPSVSDMPLSFGETISGLLRKSKVQLDARVDELLQLRSSVLHGEMSELPDVERILKELKSSVRIKADKPTVKKPVIYKASNGAAMLKHSISSSGNTKFELSGVDEKQLEKVRTFLVSMLKVGV